jgi:hypothetical protein
MEHGDGHAAEQLVPLVYDELRKLAAQKLDPSRHRSAAAWHGRQSHPRRPLEPSGQHLPGCLSPQSGGPLHYLGFRVACEIR